jgi:peptidoglycan/xylan/chitin deacetylase (PgdA/CDA1 family)
MIISHTISSLWLQVPENICTRLQHILDQHGQALIFFRADDVAIPSTRQDRLLQLFTRHGVPLCAAVIPAWMNAFRWEIIRRQVGEQNHLFAWHQHGWNHRNHESTGKKQEFGPAASRERKHKTLVRGRDKLLSIMGDQFLPVFTPPWNRLDAETMTLLRQEGFRAISRFHGNALPPPPGLPDFPVNVDLHTRREGDPKAGWVALLDELNRALSSGTVGFMLHHQRMNEAAFAFLDRLLTEIQCHPGLRLVHFGTLLNDTHRKPSLCA